MKNLKAEQSFTIAAGVLEQLKKELGATDALSVSNAIAEVNGALIAIICKSNLGPEGRELTRIALTTMTKIWLAGNKDVLDELAREMDRVASEPRTQH